MKLAALLAFLAACAAATRGPRPPSTPNATTSELRYVSCMAEPPAFEDIDWPTPDSLGNVLMHASTVDRVQDAYADLRRYVTTQYFQCLHIAKATGEQTVTVEVEP